MLVALILAISLAPAASLRLPADAIGRRSLLRQAAAASALGLSPLRARAEYGEGANLAPPALVPSPFMPTGVMADTCEVVALGREDVCLTPKKLLSAYDTLLLQKARDALDSATVEPQARPVVAGISRLAARLMESDWQGFDNDLGGLTTGDAAASVPTGALAAAAKKRDAPATAKELLKMCNEAIGPCK